MVPSVRRTTLLLATLLLCMTANAANLTMYFFYSTTCPHCHAELEFLDQLAPRYPSLEIRKFAVDTSDENLTLMNRFARAYSLSPDYGIPQTYIGDKVVIGYSTYNTHGRVIEGITQNCSKEECADPYEVVRKVEGGQTVNTTLLDITLVEYPIIGVVDMAAIPLPYLVAIALLLIVLMWAIIKRLPSRRKRS